MDQLPLPLKIKINILLRAKQYVQTAELITSRDSFREVTENGMELITEICDHGLNETEDFVEILACSEMLIYIAKYFNPKLAIISFLEQAEAFNLSSKFSVFVQPLQIILSRTPVKKPSIVAWILKVFNLHLKTFYAFPTTVKNKYNEEGIDSSIESDPETQQILYYYNELCNFYEVLIRESLNFHENPTTSSSFGVTSQENISQIRNIIRDNLVDLLGPPLVYMNLGWTEEEKPSNCPRPTTDQTSTPKCKKSEARLIIEKIMSMISNVNNDSNYFINWVEEKELKENSVNQLKHSPKGAEALPLDNEIGDGDAAEPTSQRNEDLVEPGIYSVGNYMYLLFAENLAPTQVPASIYSVQHIFCTNLFLITQLLTNPQEHPSLYLKGLHLAKGMIEQVNSFSPFSVEILDQLLHATFMERLEFLVVFCDSRPVRVAAIDVFTKYLWSFQPVGKYNMLVYLFNAVTHAGLSGHCITQLKEFIRIAINEKEANMADENTMQKYFLGPNLLRILQPLCDLENGVETDLIKSSDKIIAILNLLRYVFIRDGANNHTGIKEILENIELNLLQPLRTGLDLSKTHYELRLKTVEESNSSDLNKELELEDMTVTVGTNGEELSPEENTKENQLKMLNSALGTLDLVASLLARTNETSMGFGI